MKTRACLTYFALGCGNHFLTANNKFWEKISVDYKLKQISNQVEK